MHSAGAVFPDLLQQCRCRHGAAAVRATPAPAGYVARLRCAKRSPARRYGWRVKVRFLNPSPGTPEGSDLDKQREASLNLEPRRPPSTAICMRRLTALSDERGKRNGAASNWSAANLPKKRVAWRTTTKITHFIPAEAVD